MAEKKYYWLKLKKDFFKRHDIRIIEGMDNGKEYVLFYLKLMVESISHEGRLRFADTIPYNEKMLSSLTDTNIDIVRSAMKVLIELGLCEIMDDQTIYLSEVDKLIGDETKWAEYKRESRAKLDNVQSMSNKRLENRDKSKESRDKSLYIDMTPPLSPLTGGEGVKRFTPPTVEEVRAYCDERMNGIDPEEFCDFYESKGWMVGKNKMKSWQAAVRTWERSKKGNSAARIDWSNV